MNAGMDETANEAKRMEIRRAKAGDEKRAFPPLAAGTTPWPDVASLAGTMDPGRAAFRKAG